MPWAYQRARLVQETGWTLEYIDGLDIWTQRELVEMFNVMAAMET